MRALSIFLSVVAVLLLALMACFFMGGTLDTGATVKITPAAEAPSEFETALAALDTGVAWQKFSDPATADAADYALADITVTFRNRGFFAAEWVHASVSPGTGDVAVYSRSTDVLDVGAHGRAELRLKLLTETSGMGAGRTLEVEYYVLGARRTATISLE